MSDLIINKLVTPCGKLTNQALGGYVDAAGNIVGSAGFMPLFIVDYAGNMGGFPSTLDCELIATIIGSALPAGPWEMQQATAETVGTDMGTISNNYINAGNLTNFTSLNCTGIMAGNIGGSGTFTIQNGPQTIGGVVYAGNGLTIFTGNNTCSGILDMQPNTKIQLGADCSNSITKWGGNLTIQTGAVATQFNGWSVNTYLCQALTNTGTYNVIGCGTCGVGGLGLATTVANNGIINIDDTIWRNQSTWSGTGVVNVKDGGTFQTTTNAIGSTTRININGCGWCNATGVKVGAINMTGANMTLQARVHVQTASCIKNSVGANTTFNGLLTGSAPLTVGSLGAPVSGITVFGNQSNTYFGTLTVDGTLMGISLNALKYATLTTANGGRITANSAVFKSIYGTDATSYLTGSGNTTIENNGITKFDGRVLWDGQGVTHNIYLKGGAGNQLTLTAKNSSATFYVQGGSKLILQGATLVNGSSGQVRVEDDSIVSAGTSTDASCTYLQMGASARLEVKAVGASCGLLNVASIGVNFTAGWKVDLPDAMAAGTYDILSFIGNTTVLPTIGINNSGRTATFAYANGTNPKKLKMTLV